MTAHQSDVHGRYFITPVQMLERFLLMGSFGSYKANDKFADFPKEVLDTIETIFECFPQEAFEVLFNVCIDRKAPRKPPVLLALAAALNLESTRAQAEGLATTQISTGTDQFVLTKFLLDYGRGKGRSFKRHANTLYRTLDRQDGEYARTKLALQMIKYRNRAGWTHRDLLRVSHYKPTERNNDLFKWVVGKGPAKHDLILAYEAASVVTTPAEAVKLIQEVPNLSWEAFPTEVMANRDVWENLLPGLGNTAIIRNLGRMSALGVDLNPYLERITSAGEGLHPVASLSAWKVYSQGKGLKGSLVWAANPGVIQALEAGFYASFGELTKSQAKVCFGIDVSGSMSAHASTVPGLNCREVAAAMVMVAMKQQPYMAFGFGHHLTPLDIRDDWSLSQVMSYMAAIPYGATNCSLPMQFCTAQNIADVDLFAIYTDNETNQREKPSVALNQYRAAHNPDAKLATVALMGGAFSIADPNDPGQVDFVGFDPSVPSVMVSLAEQKLV